MFPSGREDATGAIETWSAVERFIAAYTTAELIHEYTMGSEAGGTVYLR